MISARALLHLAAASVVACAAGVASVACASLKDATPDGADASTDGSPGGQAADTDANANPGPNPGSEGGATEGGAGNGDPRWPNWRLPADVPDNSTYAVTNGADGAIITDKVTGLGWQDTVPTTARDFDAANAYCEALVYDGQSDWHLPTRIQAISIMVYKPVFGESAVAGPAFSSVSGAQCFWTSSRIPQSTTTAYAVATAGVSSTQTSSTCVARCVRGGPALGAPIAKQFVVTADTVTDPTTGLLWEKTPPGVEGTLANADARCKALVLGGRTMRLPGVKELASIVDETKRSPSSTGVFGDYSDRMFTSNDRWTIEFTYGAAVQGPNGFSYWSRCVSGP
jgi:hypothetical protein